ncbi:MAG: plastocyanin/azurin family copper-binding protein [Myxococcota bacterium]
MWKPIAAEPEPLTWMAPRERLQRGPAGAAVAAIGACALIALACASEPTPAPPPPPAVVTLTNDLHFSPSPLEVRVGQTVEWRNDSLLVHTVTLDPARAARPRDVALPAGAEPFDSGVLLPEKVFRHRFRVAGRYRYYCIPHEGAGMVGEIQVRP